MLLNWAKNKQYEKTINNWWNRFTFKHGHKHINSKNFLDLDYTYCKYKVNNRYYSGYFTNTEIDNIFKTLDYNKGKIFSLIG